MEAKYFKSASLFSVILLFNTYLPIVFAQDNDIQKNRWLLDQITEFVSLNQSMSIIFYEYSFNSK